MIDSRLLLNNFDFVAQNLSNRGISTHSLESLKSLVDSIKALKSVTENKQAEQNRHSKQYAMLAKSNSSEAESYKIKLVALKEEIKHNTALLQEKEDSLKKEILNIPNLLDSKTPIGKDEQDNVEIKRILTPTTFDFTPKTHWELAELNGWIDFEAGAKLAKSRFSVLRGLGARLNHALVSYMLDFNSKNGFEICSVPVIVNENALLGTGQLPKFANDMFKLDVQDMDQGGHNLYLISTSEVSLTNLYQDEIIPVDSLPIMLTAYTSCFRKEAGSAGRDTRGIIRQHQFDKVELVALTNQEDSESMQQRMTQNASSLLESLGLPHRLMQLCSGDIGFSATNTVDLEVWLPGQNCYREISSVSNCGDFQARRAKIRYKENGKNKLVHTLNGSSLAVGRTLVAIMENFQKQDGNIEIPSVLQKYL